jgi:hypothetical protein
MSRPFTPRVTLASAAALGITVAAAITISPASHDFGDAARQGSVWALFQLTVSPVTRGDTVRVSITGPDTADFAVGGQPNSTQAIDPTTCPVGSQGSVCDVGVEFHPQSGSILGPKAATLVVTNRAGTRVTAALKGKVVAALCQHIVVPCNYAMFYSGTFDWSSGLSGPGGSYSETVLVAVTNGVAFCSGTATDAGNGRSRTGAITGPGLIAVEFLDEFVDSLRIHRLVYRITAACPSPHWPATADEPATPSRPAELGHGEQGSYNQPATGLGMKNLVGSSSDTSPDADPANGVTGLVSVRWSLKRP